MRRFFVALVAVLAASPVSAQADVIGGNVSDPVDQPPTIGGTPEPDISSMQALYDQARGLARVDVSFYAPVGDTIYDLSAFVGVTQPDGTCSASGLYVGTSLKSSATTGTVLMGGYTGTATAAVGWSPNRQSVAVYVSLPAITTFAPNCASADTYLYDDIGHCGNYDCTWWSHTYELDTTPTVSLTPIPAGQIPPVSSSPTSTPSPRTPPSPSSPATPTRSASVRLGAVKTYPCLREIDLAGVQVGPGSMPATGKLKFGLHGISGRARGVLRTTSARSQGGFYSDISFGQLKPGRYRLVAQYTGDAARLHSPIAQRVVTLRSCI